MNFALPALVVFVLLLPGFIARAQLKVVERTSLDYSPFGQVAIEAVVWAAALHAAWIVATSILLGRVFRADILLKLVSSDTVGQTKAIDWVATEPGAIAFYLLSLVAFSYVGPRAFRWAIVRFRWDRLGSPLSGWLRFSRAPWYYLLSGAEFAADQQPDLISISGVVNVAGQSVLYSGVLEDYFFDEDGQLNRLILSEVVRRPFEKDKAPAEAGVAVDRFYPIDGDYFVLRYSEAVTLNVEYIKLTDEAVGVGVLPN